MKWQELLKRKVAGVPVVWIALIVVIVGLYAAIRLKPAADETPTDAATTDIPAGDSGDDGQPIFRAHEDTGADSDSGTLEPTNAQWGKRAIEWLIANGASVSAASIAIQKYLNSETLSQSEGVLRDKVVKQFGLPPEDVSMSNVLGYQGPATKQGVPPVTHVVRGKSDDTFKELAKLYYGLDSADTVILLMQANTTVTAPFSVGTRIRVVPYSQPKYYTATSATNTLYAIARKNSTTAARIQALNPNTRFPVEVGHSVRIA